MDLRICKDAHEMTALGGILGATHAEFEKQILRKKSWCAIKLQLETLLQTNPTDIGHIDIILATRTQTV